MNIREIVLVFCNDLKKDPVSRHVLGQVEKLYMLTDTEFEVDGNQVRYFSVPKGRIYVVVLENVLSHCYERYANFLNNHFIGADGIFIVNWHEGAKAPNAIFTVQTTGDMKAGCFSPVDPRFTRGAFLSIEKSRQDMGLEEFTTWTEATHWSGVIYGNQPGEDVNLIIPSVVDLEIGSSPEDWGNEKAAEVMARSFSDFAILSEMKPISLLCIGGIHFEPSFREFVLSAGQEHGVAVSHILPNHWLVSEGYGDESRFEDMKKCANSILGGADIIVFHDNLKSDYKNMAKKLAEFCNIPAYSHKKIKKNLSLITSIKVSVS